MRRGDRGENRRARASCGVSPCVCVCADVRKHAKSADGTVGCLEASIVCVCACVCSRVEARKKSADGQSAVLKSREPCV